MEYVKLKDITTKITKGTTPSNIGASFTDEGINYFRSEMLGKAKYLDKSSGMMFISESTHNKLKRSQIEADDILFSMAGIYLGKLAIVKDEDVPANTNQAVALIRFNKGVNIDYLYYFMVQKSFNAYVNCMSAQAAQPNINLKQIGNLQIALPSDEQQKRIADILSAYDNLIENNNKRIHLLEQMAESLYKEWFVRFRFPGYENVEFESGIPKGWKICRIDQLSKIKAGGDAPDDSSKEITDECSIPIYSNGIENEGLYGYTSKAKINKPSISISARGTVGYTCLRRVSYTPIVRLICIIPHEENLANWLFYYFKRTIVIANGTSQQQITIPMMSREKVLLPTNDLIQKFYEYSTSFLDEIDSLKAQNSNLEKQRDMLLPRLMSGKLEV